jgi:hypothetical protein
MNMVKSFSVKIDGRSIPILRRNRSEGKNPISFAMLKASLMKYRLSDAVDISGFQQILLSSHPAGGIPAAIMDLDSHVIVPFSHLPVGSPSPAGRFNHATMSG